jgi:hypothetical protein
MAKAGHNGFDPDYVIEVVEAIEEIQDDIASIKAVNAAKCKSRKNDINDHMDTAKEKGIPKTELKAVLKVRDLERKAEAARNDLEGDSQDLFDNLRLALGDLEDTPLGQAAQDAQTKKAA